MSYVWINSPSKGGRLLVLLALADRANDDGICWPGITELARKSRLSDRQVERVLKGLEKDGELELPPGKASKTSPYRIRQNVGSAGEQMSGSPDTGVDQDPTPTSVPYVEPSGESSKGTPNARAGEVTEVWQTYLTATSKVMELNEKRKRIIDTALDVALGDDQAAKLAKVKAAVIGLSLSPHHNGENDRHQEYLDIRYALKGIRDESDDERIEKMAAIAAEKGRSSAGTPIDPARIDRRLEAIRATRSSSGAFKTARSEQAIEDLEDWGFRVVLLDAAPWARLEQR